MNFPGCNRVMAMIRGVTKNHGKANFMQSSSTVSYHTIEVSGGIFKQTNL